MFLYGSEFATHLSPAVITSLERAVRLILLHCSEQEPVVFVCVIFLGAALYRACFSASCEQHKWLIDRQAGNGTIVTAACVVPRASQAICSLCTPGRNSAETNTLPLHLPRGICLHIQLRQSASCSQAQCSFGTRLELVTRRHSVAPPTIALVLTANVHAPSVAANVVDHETNVVQLDPGPDEARLSALLQRYWCVSTSLSS